MTAPPPPALVAVLELARARGFLGPGPVIDHVAHAQAMGATVAPHPRRFLDLGSGGGIPGLVLALVWPEATGVLLDAGERRCAFLQEALGALGFVNRISVACGRAEDLARAEGLREAFDLVVVRSFGPPAVAAECAVGFLEVGGKLLVSEPPGGGLVRWPSEGLRHLGFHPPVDVPSESATFTQIVKAATADRWPRRRGIPAKRPLWNTTVETTNL